MRDRGHENEVKGKTLAIQEVNSELVGLLRNIDGTLVRLAESVTALMTVDEDRNYSKREAARILGCSVRTIERRIRDGKLVAVSAGVFARVTGASMRRLQDMRHHAAAASVLKL